MSIIQITTIPKMQLTNSYSAFLILFYISFLFYHSIEERNVSWRSCSVMLLTIIIMMRLQTVSYSMSRTRDQVENSSANLFLNIKSYQIQHVIFMSTLMISNLTKYTKRAMLIYKSRALYLPALQMK